MTTLVETRYGMLECFDAEPVISNALKLYGEWAQLELEVLERFVPDGGTVLDVGAFIGTHTVALARMVGTAGRVHSFEPRAAVRALLQANAERNRLSQVHVHACALGSADASLDVAGLDADISADRPVNFGGLRLEEAAVDADGGTERIRVRRLDAFGFDRLDLIKIDVEGMEADVVRGGRETLARCRPVIFAECNDLEKGIDALRAFLSLGHVVFGTISPAYNPRNHRNNPENVFGEAAEVSLLALPPERVADAESKGLLQGLARIDTADALVLLLMHKAQYPFEALASTSAAAALGLDYPSPLSREMRKQLAAAHASQV
jgi:FkbM family methyltransferase